MEIEKLLAAQKLLPATIPESGMIWMHGRLFEYLRIDGEYIVSEINGNSIPVIFSPVYPAIIQGDGS
jgi:hypothetical protein